MKFRANSILVSIASALAAGTLLVGAAGAAGPPPGVRLDPKLRVHPMLQYGAQVEPDKRVRVLVRKLNAHHSGGDIASSGGGDLKDEFSLFNISSIEIAQKDVLKLARDPRVLYVSPDGAVGKKQSSKPRKPLDADKLAEEAGLKALSQYEPQEHAAASKAPDVKDLVTTYPLDVHVQAAWKDAREPITGAGVTVAVLDSGVDPFHGDFQGQVYPVFVNPKATGYLDELGHGTHVIGIITGRSPSEQYIGIAPDSRVISVKIADDKGHATESDMLRGLVWVHENRAKYHIKAVNLSLGAATPQSFRFSPIDAAVEMLWHSGVTVVASSGNAGTDKTATWSAPGNDPYVITVGCLDDNQTLDPSDDSVCSFSSRGVTQDGFAKPNIVAPGRKVYSTLAEPKSQIGLQYPDRISPDRKHIRLSGTSMSTPVVTGAVALLLQRFPDLKPNQVKWLLDTSAHKYPGQSDNAGELDIAAALGLARHGSVPQANQDLGLGRTLGGGNLGGSSWLNAYWDNAYWDHAYWDNAYWDHAYWDNAYWDHAYWDNAYWDHAYWDSAGAID